MLTRRVRGRTFLLRPSPETNRLIAYVLAVVARKWRMRIVAVIAMSNHWHVVLMDDEGNIVDFTRDCHSFIGRALNACYQETESVWSSTRPNRVEAVGAEDFLAQIAYTMANPVESCLVAHGKSWPGLRRSWPSKPKLYRRPDHFFSAEEKGGDWPKEAALVLYRPDGYEHLSDEELAKLVTRTIREREQRFRDQHRKQGRHFLGRRAILRQSRHARPTSPPKHSDRVPTIACRDPELRQQRLQTDREWRIAYTDSFRRWQRGERDVLFPPGTYLMRVRHNVRCAEPPG